MRSAASSRRLLRRSASCSISHTSNRCHRTAKPSALSSTPRKVSLLLCAQQNFTVVVAPVDRRRAVRRAGHSDAREGDLREEHARAVVGDVVCDVYQGETCRWRPDDQRRLVQSALATEDDGEERRPCDLLARPAVGSAVGDRVRRCLPTGRQGSRRRRHHQLVSKVPKRNGNRSCQD